MPPQSSFENEVADTVFSLPISRPINRAEGHRRSHGLRASSPFSMPADVHLHHVDMSRQSIHKIHVRHTP